MLQDYKYPEVRVRNGSKLQQIPNYVIAGEDLKNGQFVRYGKDGKFYVCQHGEHRATHLVQRSGIARVTIDEISHNVGIVKSGEPTMAYTGEGIATIPFAESVTKGTPLTVYNGYAVSNVDLNYANTFTIGTATEDVTLASGATLAWGEAMIVLPAQYQGADGIEI